MSNYKTIQFHLSNRVAYVSLDRAELANALDFLTVKELKEVLSLCSSLTDVRVIVIRGNGEHFSTGTDLHYIRQLQEKFGVSEMIMDSKFMADLFLTIKKLPKLVIAQAEGKCWGSGLSLALSCDIIVASQKVDFAFPEVNKGFMPLVGLTMLISRIGEGRAREMLLTGRHIESETALHWGLANYVIPNTDISAWVEDYALDLAAKTSPGSIEIIKKLLVDTSNMPLEGSLEFASKLTGHARVTKEYYLGIQAFLEKKENRW
jgi:methylglutaconyl-CoA hydratase